MERLEAGRHVEGGESREIRGTHQLEVLDPVRDGAGCGPRSPGQGVEHRRRGPIADGMDGKPDASLASAPHHVVEL